MVASSWSAPRAMAMSTDQSDTRASLAGSGSKAMGEKTSASACGKATTCSGLTTKGIWSAAACRRGSAISRPAGVVLKLSGWAKIGPGVALKTSVEYHWLVGTACLVIASVRKGAAGGGLSPLRGASSTVPLPTFCVGTPCASTLPSAPRANTAPPRTCPIRFIDNLQRGPAWPLRSMLMKALSRHILRNTRRAGSRAPRSAGKHGAGGR
jgi:hypothetical protein